MKGHNMTRDDMIEFTQLSYDRPEPIPQPPDWVKKHIKGKFRLTNSNTKGGDTKPSKDIPGFREELKKNQDKSHKRGIGKKTTYQSTLP